MKALLINSLYHPMHYGGAERSVQYLAESLVERGHQVVVVALKPENSDPRSTVGGVKVVRLPLRNLYWPFDDKPRPAPFRKLWTAMDAYNPAMERALFEIIKQEAPDIVHSNNLQGFSVAAWRAAKRNGKPVLHTLRDYYLTCGRATRWQPGGPCRTTCLPCRPFRATRGHCTSWVDGVVGNSRFILDAHGDLGCFAQAKFRRAIHTSCPPAPEPRAYDTSRLREKLVFGYLGRLQAIKGVEQLIGSLCQASDDRWGLLIAGDGDQHNKQRLRRQRERSANPDAIEFLGHVDPDELFERIDVLCVPSLWEEPYSRAVIEAGARGIAVIASDRGGHPEAIKHGETGLLFDPEEPRSLSDAIDLLFKAPELIGRLGAAAYGEARTRDPDRIARDYEDMYQSLLSSA